jgi:hypothetical protein
MCAIGHNTVRITMMQRPRMFARSLGGIELDAEKIEGEIDRDALERIGIRHR